MPKVIIKGSSGRISELEVILKQKSQTRSKPPSIEGYKKPKPTSSRGRKATRVRGLRRAIKEVAFSFPCPFLRNRCLSR